MSTRRCIATDRIVAPFALCLGLIACMWIILINVLSASSATGPITPSGLNTLVSEPIAVGAQTQYNITGGTRPGGGGNLFHSFGEFNVPTNNIANFLNETALPTNNILGRVTGGNLSSIYGTIQTEGFGGANLFLINPAGFLFGPGATVNVGGMVAFTTADYLRLAELDGSNAGIFHADPAANSTLTTAPVAAYGFLGSNPGAITVQGSQFTVAAGKTLSLVGGDITIGADPDTGTPASISAPAGQIDLVSVTSPGEILHSSLQTGENINGQSVTTMGTISLTGGSLIDVSDYGFEAGGAAGSIRIRGGQFVMDSSVMLANTMGDVDGANPGMSIVVQDDVIVSNLSVMASQTFGPGRSGDIEITARNVDINGGSVVLTSGSAEGQTGQAGNISIIASESVAVRGTDEFGQPSSVMSVSAQATLEAETLGDSGSILIHAPSVTVEQGGLISTIEIATGRAGDITIETANLNLLTGGTIDTVGAGLDSSSGNITITASNSVTIAGQLNPDQLSKIHNRVDGDNMGAQGDISISAKQILLSEQGQIRAENSAQGGGSSGNVTLNAEESITLESDARIVTKANYTTVGGITLSAPTIRVDHATIFARTVNEFQGGAITLNGNTLTISNGSEILSSTEQSTGQGGTITLSASDSVSMSGGSVARSSSLAAAEGPAGPIAVTAGNLVSLSGAGTGLFTETFGSGNGGAIVVQAPHVEITDGAVITASSTGSGAAGSVTIQGNSPAQSLVIDGAGSGIFTDTTDTGAGGNIFTNATQVTLQNGGALSATTSGTADTATGGTITVTAEHITLTNQAVLTTESNGIAPAGFVELNTGSVVINSGSQVRSSTGTQAAALNPLAAAATSPLTGGTITVQGRTGAGSQAETVSLDGAGSGIFTQSSGDRPGGDINVLASQAVTLDNNASISASSTGAGNAGHIQLVAGGSFLATNSSVTAQATQAGGGTIKITTDPGGAVQLTNSTISASVLDGTGGGGSVNIDPQYVLLQNSQILANAVQGPGGNILITTNLLLPDATSLISASSQFGVNGTVTVQSPISQAGGKIQPLGKSPLLATSLINQRCAALAGGSFSSFTVAGRDALPAEPGSWLANPLAALGTGVGLEARGERWEPRTQNPELITEESALLSLRQIAPPGFLTQAFAVDQSAGCTS